PQPAHDLIRVLFHQTLRAAPGRDVGGFDVEAADLRAPRVAHGDAAGNPVAAGQDTGPKAGRVGTHVVVGQLDLDAAGAGFAARGHQAGLQQAGVDQAV